MIKPRILVIEDELRMRNNVVTILRMEGFDVSEAGNGREGLALASKMLPDLILCDVSMPELDGHGALAALKEDPNTAGVPFIFLTARGERGDLRAGMNGGADDYLVKPVDATELLAAIEARLRRKSELASNKPAREPSPAALIPLGLTEREAETLFWLAQGKSNSDLCILLEVKLTTIKKHLERIYQKLGVENRTSAAAMAMEVMGGG